MMEGGKILMGTSAPEAPTTRMSLDPADAETATTAKVQVEAEAAQVQAQVQGTPKAKRIPSYLRMTKSASAKKSRKRVAESPIRGGSASKKPRRRPSSAQRRPSMKLTQPRGPKLASSMRSRTARAFKTNAAEKKTTASFRTSSGPVKAFSFEKSSLSPAAAASDGKFESMAQKVHKFQHKTPHRFHTKGKTSQKTPLPKPVPMELTECEEPMFKTDMRTRYKHGVMSTEEKEYAYVRSNSNFKARPVNTKVMKSSGDIGVPRIKKKPTCVPKAFSFATARRTRTKSEDDELQNHQNESTRRLSKSNRNRSGSNELTNPTSPKLATRARRASSHRARPKSSAELEMEAIQKYHEKTRAAKEKKMMKKDKRKEEGDFQASSRRPSLTVPKPFRLSVAGEENERRAQAELARKRQEKEARDTAKRNFKASGMPSYPDPMPVKVSTKPLCEPKGPSFLESDEMQKRTFLAKAAEEEIEEAKKRNFVATGLPVTTYEKDFSFQKGIGDFKPCKPRAFRLSTDARTKERSEYDAKIAERALEEAARKEKAEAERKKAEEESIKNYRKSLVHKPLPLPATTYAFAPSNSMPRPTPLTEPMTPQLTTKTRSRNKENIV